MSRTKKNWDHLVQNDGTYAIDIKNGIWPGSGVANKGDLGPKGDTGNKGNRGPAGPQGKKGEVGPAGDKGDLGPEGKSAYQVALDDGFIGSEAEWLATLEGNKGEPGATGATGSFDDLTDAQKESLKGEQGVQGEKGDVSGIFEFKGSVADLAALNALPGPHAVGDVYKTDDTDDLYVYDGGQFVLLSESIEVVKGEKGEVAEKGDDGADGEKGEKGTVGEKGDDGDTGTDGTDGKSAYELAVDNGYTGTEVEWLAELVGDKGAEGEKGEQGSSAYDLSQKGLDPGDIISEDDWLESLKGEKGEAADASALDDYYTKGQTDQLLTEIPQPEDAYNVHEMPAGNDVAAGVAASFNDQDPAHILYNPGLVTVQSGAVVNDSPVPAPFVIRNTILNDPAGLRDTTYTLLQEIIQVTGGNVISVVRTARPGTNSFSPWSQSTFASESYYDKTEVDGKVNAINYTLDHDTGSITLTDKTGDVQSVLVEGKNGISVTSDATGIVVDGSALTPTPQFLGILQDSQDPGTIQPAPVDGQYFIYGYTGSTVGTDGAPQDCTPGDWCIYNTDKWLFLDISSNTGVMTVGVSGGLLTRTVDDPANPVIGLDPSRVVTPSQLESYVKISDFAAATTSRRIGDLIDVEITYTRTQFNGSDSRSVYSLNVGNDDLPEEDGERGTDIDNNKVLLYLTSSSGQVLSEFYNNIDVNADPKQLVRISGHGVGIGDGQQRVGNVVSKTNKGAYVEIEFDTASVPLFSSGFEGEVIFDIVTGEASNGDILVFDSTDHTWKAGEAGGYVKKDGDTMSGALTVSSRDSVADDESMFAIAGQQASGGLGSELLTAQRKSADGDQVRYYGPVKFGKEITTKEYVDGGFLPLTGGTLEPGPGGDPTLVLKGSSGLADTDNILKVSTGGGDDLLRLLNDKTAVFEGELRANTLVVKTATNSLSVREVGEGSEISSSGGMILKVGTNQTWAHVTAGYTSFGYEKASSQGALFLNDAEVHITKPLFLNYDPGEDGQVMVSKGSSARPEWQDLGALDGYLLKTGGTMTGDLSMKGNKVVSLAAVDWDSSSTFGLTIDLTAQSTHHHHLRVDGRNGHTGMIDLNDDGDGANLVVNGRQTISSPKTDDTEALIVKVAGLGGDGAFRVNGNGAVCAGKDSSNPFLATATNHLCTKAFFDAELAKIPTAANMLPLAGGTMTGTIKSKLVKCTRDTGFAFEVKPDDVVTRGSWNTSGRLDITMESGGDAAIRTIGSINVKAAGQTISGTNTFIASQDYARYYGPITDDNDVATKKYVEDNGGGVVLHTSTTPPSGRDRGTLMLTTDDKLYIYV